ncbi:SHO1 (YER118C) [Zygosaccharomyces parabailii]|uniref:High osmolarity signaling protein SHO1 n=1 Tax=Zygosaccharomyces bailii (strain CLIB 213 / ATCC 58445 / CBS 680 / BCRC 21525 / NBRC 1098 / NCYC 1416 / NRRL Y-2227) TaxID=1333698 RepID=A0A8J2T9J8_ZYGB2|nr:SHO1 (YER118C) [Zygosaccharomyces parabailii]CDF90791.1 ZYBA0S08-03092g1_1 [Zygosaccharomyces bailii CLIB 213]CDH08974.1 probable High osmolarity signaling protein SHO1 [Zygosaccharomyces bailii ISA1307]SJM85384.1 probable High osmolarity signaling protein SHO1 [Zygosaccharomyces bailii]
MDKVPMPSRAKARAQRKKLHIKHSFNLNNLLSDPFALSTISIGILSWCIAIAGCIATASGSDNFPRFTWWGIAYQFLILFMLVTFYCYDIVDYYKNFITGATAVSFVYNTNSATILVYGDGSRKAAASAGVILLSIVNLIWIFYYGSDNASPTSRWIDSFSLRGIRPSATQDAFMRARRRTRSHLRSQRYTGENFYPDQQPQNYMSSTALTGFENPDPAYFSGSNPPIEGHASVAYSDNNVPGNLSQQNIMMNNQSTLNQSTFNQNTFMTETSNGNTDTTMGGTLELYSDTGEENFPYTAKTLYRYEADADDAYEISFEQGEILKVSDIEGRWWKAKRSNGETGIIPSNYVQLIDDNVL